MDSCACSLPQRDIVTTGKSFVYNGSVIPKGDSSWSPFPAYAEIVRLEKMLTEERHDVGRFLPVELVNAVNEGWIVIQDL